MTNITKLKDYKASLLEQLHTEWNEAMADAEACTKAHKHAEAGLHVQRAKQIRAKMLKISPPKALEPAKVAIQWEFRSREYRIPFNYTTEKLPDKG